MVKKDPIKLAKPSPSTASQIEISLPSIIASVPIVVKKVPFFKY